MKNKYYNNFDFYNKKSTGNFHLIEKFKTIQQNESNSCGPICAKMILNHYLQNVDIGEDELIKIFNSRPYPVGTSLKDMIIGIKKICDNSILSSLDSDKFESFEDFKKFVLKYIDNKIPIIVENVDYGGHYRVIIGYDEVSSNKSQDMLIFADPSDFNDGKEDGYNYFPAERFFYMWFDAKCLNKDEKQQPFIIILPKL